MTDNMAPLTQKAEGGSYIAQAAQGGTAIVEVHHPPTPIQEQNRVRFLTRLRYAYQSIWEQSLHGAALLTLGLVEQPDAVLHPPSLYFQSEEQTARPLPTGTSILQVYEGAGQELLILGEPGAGKSMLLLDLARQLVKSAEQDGQYPIPVIVPLSSWAVKRPPFADWLAEQLVQLYDLPRKLSQAWIRDNQFLLLLDGLDEVSQDARVACLEAITMYRKDHLVPLVICSRRNEYEEIQRSARLVLNSAVIVQPLTSEQVEDYLVQAGNHLMALRTTLQTNTELQELVATPLMLNILALTYADASVEDLPHRGSAEQQQRIIFDKYVERMVKRKGDQKSYPLQQTISWLGWLARQMREHNQTIFYLEHLQPAWLTPTQRRKYAWRAVRLPAIGIGVLASLFLLLSFPSFAEIECVLFGGFLGWLFSRFEGNEGRLLVAPGIPRHQKRVRQMAERFGISLGISLGVGLMAAVLSWGNFSLLYGSTAGLSTFLLQYLPLGASQSIPSKGRMAPQRGKYRGGRFQTMHVRRALWVAVVVGTSAGLSELLGRLLGALLSHTLRNELGNALSSDLGSALSEVVNVGLIMGFITLLVSLTLDMQAKDIHLAERLRWTRKSLARSLFTPKHLSATALLVSLTGITIVLSQFLREVPSVGLSSDLSGWLFALRNWLNPGLSDWLFALRDGLSAGLSVGLSYWVLFGLFQGVSQERVEDQDRRIFNQGIRRSLRNSRIMGFISGGVIGVIVVLSGVLSNTLSEIMDIWLPIVGFEGVQPFDNFGYASLIFAAVPAVIGGLLVWAISGRLAVRKHYVIRRLLWHSQTFPWKAEAFLNDATMRILMRRVGGGYSFTHRLLLDYFASLEETVPQHSPTEQATTTRSVQPTVEQPSTEPVAEVLLEEPTVPLRIKQTRTCVCGYEEERPGVRFCPRCGKALA